MNVTVIFFVLSIRFEYGTRIQLEVISNLPQPDLRWLPAHYHNGKRLIRIRHIGIPGAPDRLPQTVAGLTGQPLGEFYECFDIEMDQTDVRSQPPEIKKEI